MNKLLPERPNLGHLKKEAKDLLRSWNRSLELDRLPSHPKPPALPKLADAQLVLAREYGFPSWPNLKRLVELKNVETPEGRFIEAACIPAVGNHVVPALDMAQALWTPELMRDFACACVYGDHEAVRELLRENPGLARRKTGHRKWEPMLYVCFSAYASPRSNRAADMAQTARMLLEAGAKPNPQFFAYPGDPDSWEPAIYGAAGLFNNPALTEVLLRAGVDPNDYETPYHAPEHNDIAALKVVWPKLDADARATAALRLCDHHNYPALEWTLANGADPNHRGVWEDQALHHSIRRLCDLPYQKLILRHGGDPNGKTKSGFSVYQIAAMRGRTDVIELIAGLGAINDLTPTQSFAYALSIGDGPAARKALASDPGLIERLTGDERLAMNWAAGQGRLEAVRLMLELGMPAADHGVNGDTPLHYAASLGHLDVVKLLVEAGAPIDSKQMGGLTPRELAEEFIRGGWMTQPVMTEIVEYLASLESRR